MEFIFSCDVCSEDYNNTSTIPIVLNCGHSFCSPCIGKMSNFICPKCRAYFHGQKEFPINYSMLNVIDECKSAKKFIPDIVCRIQDLKKKISIRLTSIEKDISVKSTQQNGMKRSLSHLRNLEEEDLNEDFRRSKVRKILNDMEKRYANPSDAEYEDYTKVVHNFLLRKSENNDAFLQEVYNALKNFEKVFAFKRIEKKLKFGELTVRDNQIHIHSVSLDEHPEGSKTVPFVDLKEASREKTLHTFIEISGKNNTSHVIIINLQDKVLCPHFIKLCSGEEGPSYKNCAYYRKGKIIPIADDGKHNSGGGFDWDYSYKKKKLGNSNTSILYAGISKDLPVDYYKNMSSIVECIKNEVIVTERERDGFKLSRVHGTYNFSIMGKVTYPSNIWEYVNDSNSSPCKILDSGIVIEL